MSKYIEKTIGGKEWKFRLTTGEMVALERVLKKNPIDLVIEMHNGRIPMVTQVCDILFYSLKTHHPTLSREKMYKLYDQMIDDGWDLFKATKLITEIFDDAGLMPTEDDEESEDEEDEEKNE